MPTITEKTHPIDALLRDVLELARYGNSSVVRRIVTRILLEAAREGVPTPGTEHPACLPDRTECRPGLCLMGRTLDTQEMIDEFQAEDRRRVVFLDPKENALAHFVDFLTGRVRVLELRDVEEQYDSEQLKQAAIEQLRGRAPVVTINHALAADTQEALLLLRAAADHLERGAGAMDVDAQALAAVPGVLGPATQETCTRVTEVVGTQWVDNGRRLQTHFVDKMRCCRRDSCCGNLVCSERVVGERWVDSWADTGNPGAPPPVKPPGYTAQPWGNQLPVFADPNVGTLTSDYGWRTVDGQLTFHSGLDIASPPSTTVRTNVGGTIVHVSFGPDESRGIIVRDANNVTHTFWHVDPSGPLAVGAPVNPGDTLGRVFDWGSRSHLHYAEHTPPGGDWNQRAPENSRNPLAPHLLVA